MKKLSRQNFVASGALVFALVLDPSVAAAAEPVAAAEPRLLSETAEMTTVADGFDRSSGFPFEVNLTLGFRYTRKTANIRRESALFQPGLSTGGFAASTENVARYSENRSILDLGADIGLYKDLALVLRLPVILSDSRELSDLDGSSRNPQRLQDPAGGQLFRVPFRSPTRSGIDYFQVGLNYALTNQQRQPTMPTWVIGIEGRFGVGPRLHACNDDGAVKCPDPSNPSQSRDPGISRGTNAVAFHTIVSRRIGYLEPYAGFRFDAEFPQASSDFNRTDDLQGVLLNRPPLVGTFTLGSEVIPWERRDQFQRVVLDLRGRMAYHSPGRDYSELFDALGSSTAASLRSGNAATYVRGPDGVTSVADPNGQRVFFTGITDQQAFTTFGGMTQVTWQAGEFIKFSAGFGLTFIQSHFLSSAEACNPDFKGNIDAAGPCKGASGGSGLQPVTGIPNPNHRAVIDAPGRRFSVDDAAIIDLFLSGIVMF